MSVSGDPSQPGGKAQLTLVPVRVPEQTEMVTVRVGDRGDAGEYEVTIVFRHPVGAAGWAGRVPQAAELAGDSGMGIPAPTTFRLPLAESASVLTIDLIPNMNGRLGKAFSRIVAASPGEAVSLVQNHLGALLSRLCFELDAPVVVLQVDAKEVKTGTVTQHVIVRGQTHHFSTFPHVKVAPAFLRAALSIYREGLGSISPYYSLLCFYRVAEASSHYCTRVAKLRIQRGLDPSHERPILEDLDNIAADFPDFIGRSCSQIIDVIRKQYRVPVAHGLSLNETLLAADQVDQESDYWRAVPVARQVARKFLQLALQLRDALGDAPIHDLGE